MVRSRREMPLDGRKPRVTSEPKPTRPSGFPRHIIRHPVSDGLPNDGRHSTPFTVSTSGPNSSRRRSDPVLLRGPSHFLRPLLSDRTSSAGTAWTTRTTMPPGNARVKPWRRNREVLPRIRRVLHRNPHRGHTFAPSNPKLRTSYKPVITQSHDAGNSQNAAGIRRRGRRGRREPRRRSSSALPRSRRACRRGCCDGNP